MKILQIVFGGYFFTHTVYQSNATFQTHLVIRKCISYLTVMS